MTIEELVAKRDNLVMVPGKEKDLTEAVYNVGIALVERLDAAKPPRSRLDKLEAVGKAAMEWASLHTRQYHATAAEVNTIATHLRLAVRHLEANDASE